MIYLYTYILCKYLYEVISPFYHLLLDLLVIMLHIFDDPAQSAGCLIFLIGSDAFLYSSILGMSGLWSLYRSNLINHFLDEPCTLNFRD